MTNMEPFGQDTLKLYPINYSIKNSTVFKTLASLFTLSHYYSVLITPTHHHWKGKVKQISNSQTLALTLLLSNISESVRACDSQCCQLHRIWNLPGTQASENVYDGLYLITNWGGNLSYYGGTVSRTGFLTAQRGKRSWATVCIHHSAFLLILKATWAAASHSCHRDSPTWWVIPGTISQINPFTLKLVFSRNRTRKRRQDTLSTSMSRKLRFVLSIGYGRPNFSPEELSWVHRKQQRNLPSVLTEGHFYSSRWLHGFP